MNITEDEVYQRRVAMSTGFKPASQPASVATAVDVTGTAAIVISTPARAETGEEAYLRRVAMSQGLPPPPSQPAPSTGDEAYQRRIALSGQQVPLPHRQLQPSEPSDSSEYNTFAQSVEQQPSSIPSAAFAGDVTPEFEERVRNSRNAAAAIAAKFSALVPPIESKDSSEPALEESEPGLTTRYASRTPFLPL
jgi:splicing factor 45